MAGMRLGVIVLQIQPWRALADDFRAIEEIGYDVAYVADHLTHPTLAGRWSAFYENVAAVLDGRAKPLVSVESMG